MTPAAYHIHLDRPPYCVTHTAYRERDMAEVEKAAIENAKTMGGVLLGPYGYDYASCMYRLSRLEEDAENGEVPDPVVTPLEPDEYLMDPAFKGQYKKGPHSERWHIHSDTNNAIGPHGGWCRSHETEAGARELQEVMQRTHPEDNVRVIGPVHHPAIACAYYHRKKREAEEAEKVQPEPERRTSWVMRAIERREIQIDDTYYIEPTTRLDPHRKSWHIHQIDSKHPCTSHSTDYMEAAVAEEVALGDAANLRVMHPNRKVVVIGPVNFMDVDCAWRAQERGR